MGYSRRTEYGIQHELPDRGKDSPALQELMKLSQPISIRVDTTRTIAPIRMAIHHGAPERCFIATVKVGTQASQHAMRIVVATTATRFGT